MFRILAAIVLFLSFVQSAMAAPVQIEGFEMGSNAGCQSVSGTTAISTTTVKSGIYSLRNNPGAASTLGNCRLATMSTAGLNTTGFNTASLWTRFYFRIATAPAANEEQFYVVLDTAGSDKAYFTINSARNIKSYNNAGTLVATGTTVLALNTWYLIETLTSTGAGTQPYEIKINGSVELTGSMNMLTNNHGSVRLGKGSNLFSQAIDFFYDDFQANDSAYPGDGSILVMTVDSNGSTESWIAGDAVCTGNNANCWQGVDEIPTDDDTTYVQNTTSGAALFNFISSSTAGISGTINSVKLFTRFREVVDGSAATVVRIRSNATNSDSASNNIGTSFVNRFRLLNIDPNTSAAWTTTGLDAVEGGVNEGTALQVDRLTSVNMQVDFLAGTATPTPTPTNTPTATPTFTPSPTPTFTPTPIALRLLSQTGVGQ